MSFNYQYYLKLNKEKFVRVQRYIHKGGMMEMAELVLFALFCKRPQRDCEGPSKPLMGELLNVNRP